MTIKVSQKVNTEPCQLVKSRVEICKVNKWSLYYEKDQNKSWL